VRSGVVLQVVRCGQVRSGVAGAVNSQTAQFLAYFCDTGLCSLITDVGVLPCHILYLHAHHNINLETIHRLTTRIVSRDRDIIWLGLASRGN